MFLVQVKIFLMNTGCMIQDETRSGKYENDYNKSL